MDSPSHSTFPQNIVFIREAIEEIIRPEEIGAYSEDAQRLYRARKFDWIKALVEQMQDPKAMVTDTNKCEIIVFLAINELRWVRFLQKFNLYKYEFFPWEKKLIKGLYAIIKKRDTTLENIATRVIDVLKADNTYAKEHKLLKSLLEDLRHACQRMGLVEAEHTFKMAAKRIPV